jgi:hypothetical protein
VCGMGGVGVHQNMLMRGGGEEERA